MHTQRKWAKTREQALMEHDKCSSCERFTPMAMEDMLSTLCRTPGSRNMMAPYLKWGLSGDKGAGRNVRQVGSVRVCVVFEISGAFVCGIQRKCPAFYAIGQQLTGL